jgi:hypothetical protein
VAKKKLRSRPAKKAAARGEQGGTLDLQMMEYAARLDSEYTPLRRLNQPPQMAGVEMIPAEKDRRTRVRVTGRHLNTATNVYLNGRPLGTRFIDQNNIEAELPDYVRVDSATVGVFTISDGPPPTRPASIMAAARRPAIVEITPVPETPKVDEPFKLKINFSTAAELAPTLLHVAVVFPNAEEQEGYFAVSVREAAAGAKTLGNFRSGAWGTMKVRITAYAASGEATTRTVRFDVVPSNPFQVAVYPRYYSVGGKGAVQFESSTGRYYCRARCVFSNGLNRAVTINRPVHVRVTDGGSEVTSFNFNLSSTHTVAANSSLTLYVYTYYRNSDTADIFEGFGDVRIQLRFSTSEGNRSDDAVWVMMGQLKVACNYVGSFSSSERNAVQSVVLGSASAVWEQVDLSITSGPILEIPSSNSDFGRFRDIRFDSCKNGVSSDEADDLRSGWSSPDTYSRHVDLWFVESFSGESCASSTGGFSPRPGPASKSGSNSGVVIDVDDLNILTSTSGQNILRVVVAHELGHYLGLEHHGSASNFMAASTGGTNTAITWDQHNIMDNHDWLQRRNP